MSFSRVIPHPASRYIEVVLDGYVDWLESVQMIEQIVASTEELGVYRILLDFERVDMHVAVAEAPDVAKFFHVFANHELSFGIVRSGDERGDATVEAFAVGMRALGHEVEYLETRAATEDWVSMRSPRTRRAG